MWKSYVVTKIEVGPLWVLQALAMCFFCILTLDVSGPLSLSPCLSHLPMDSHRIQILVLKQDWLGKDEENKEPIGKSLRWPRQSIKSSTGFLKLGTCVAAGVSCSCWWLHLGLFQNATPRRWSGGLVVLLLEVLGWLQQRRDSGLTGCLSWRVSYEIALLVSEI